LPKLEVLEVTQVEYRHHSNKLNTTINQLFITVSVVPKL